MQSADTSSRIIGPLRTVGSYGLAALIVVLLYSLCAATLMGRSTPGHPRLIASATLEDDAVLVQWRGLFSDDEIEASRLRVEINVGVTDAAPPRFRQVSYEQTVGALMETQRVPFQQRQTRLAAGSGILLIYLRLLSDHEVLDEGSLPPLAP